MRSPTFFKSPIITRDSDHDYQFNVLDRAEPAPLEISGRGALQQATADPLALSARAISEMRQAESLIQRLDGVGVMAFRRLINNDEPHLQRVRVISPTADFIDDGEEDDDEDDMYDGPW